MKTAAFNVIHASLQRKWIIKKNVIDKIQNVRMATETADAGMKCPPKMLQVNQASFTQREVSVRKQ